MKHFYILRSCTEMFDFLQDGNTKKALTPLRMNM